MTVNPKTVSQVSRPCVLHKTHAPATQVNELHHPIPQSWQEKMWGEVKIGAVPCCATGHNNFHEALRRVCNHGEKIPHWCQGETRRMVLTAIAWREVNMPGVKAP